MRKEINQEYGFKTLYADEGKVFINSENVITTELVMPIDADESEWTEINEEDAPIVDDGEGEMPPFIPPMI